MMKAAIKIIYVIIVLYIISSCGNDFTGVSTTKDFVNLKTNPADGKTYIYLFAGKELQREIKNFPLKVNLTGTVSPTGAAYFSSIKDNCIIKINTAGLDYKIYNNIPAPGKLLVYNNKTLLFPSFVIKKDNHLQVYSMDLTTGKFKPFIEIEGLIEDMILYKDTLLILSLYGLESGINYSITAVDILSNNMIAKKVLAENCFITQLSLHGDYLVYGMNGTKNELVKFHIPELRVEKKVNIDKDAGLNIYFINTAGKNIIVFQADTMISKEPGFGSGTISIYNPDTLNKKYSGLMNNINYSNKLVYYDSLYMLDYTGSKNYYYKLNLKKAFMHL